MKIKIKKWHIVLLFFICLITWIRYEIHKEEEDERKYNQLMRELAHPLPMDKTAKLWRKAYSFASGYNERRFCLGKEILSYEQMGDFQKATKLLYQYEDEFETCTPTLVHRAMLLSKMGNTHKAKWILDSICSAPNVYKEPSTWEKAEDFILLGNKKTPQNEAYTNVLFEYVCKLVAFSYRAGLETDSLKRLNCFKQFEKLSNIDPYIKEYSAFIEDNNQSYSFYLNERIRILQQTHLYLFQNSWDPNNAIDDVLRFKWTFLQMYLDEYDRCHGYKRTKTHFKNLLKKCGLASEGYQRYLVDAYLNIDSGSSNYNMQYEEFKNLRRGTFRWLVKLTPMTIFGKSSAFINAGITKPCILIRCNDWALCDSVPFTRGTALRYKGKMKHVIVLTDDYKTDTINTNEDLLGVKISYRPATSMTIDMMMKQFLSR